MIKVKRSFPPPKILDYEKNKKSGDYNQKEVWDVLVTDFRHKCYICENDRASSLNIEHKISHQGNRELMFKWENLFLSCEHCNGIKSTKYDNILDCTNESNDVENWIRYKIDPYPMKYVEIESLKNDIRVDKTVELLLKVYNGTTHQKNTEADNIRECLLDELLAFQQLLRIYYDRRSNGEEKLIAKSGIRKCLDSNSAFTAFKRWIVKDSDKLYIEFKEFLSDL